MDEDGRVVDQNKFNMALQALAEEKQAVETPSRRLMLPPWWLLHQVKPKGEPKDQGGWTAVTFSKEQQERYAVDEEGKVLDEDKHATAIHTLVKERAGQKLGGEAAPHLKRPAPKEEVHAAASRNLLV